MKLAIKDIELRVLCPYNYIETIRNLYCKFETNTEKNTG